MEMLIRRAVPDDLAALAEIEAQCFPPRETCSPAHLAERLERFPECFFLAEQGGRVLGSVCGMAVEAPRIEDAFYAWAGFHRPSAPWQTVLSLAVDPCRQGLGVGQRLMSFYIGLALGRGKRGLVLACRDGLIPFYRSLGFVRQGPSASRYGGGEWNEMVLRF